MGIVQLWAVLLVWIALSVAVNILAVRFSRGSGRWFLAALLFTPVLAAIFLLVSGSVYQCPECQGGIEKDRSSPMIQSFSSSSTMHLSNEQIF